MLADAAVAVAMPSTSARAGGIFMPIVGQVSAAAGSTPAAGDDPGTPARLGGFLTSALLHSSSHSSNLWLTGAAQNLFCLQVASTLGVDLPGAFGAWTLAALAPSVLLLLATPLVCYAMDPPEVRATPDAPAAARAELRRLGPLSRREWEMTAATAGTVVLWVLGDAVGVAPLTAALGGLSALLLMGTLTWAECLDTPAAWDTLVWFAALIGLSGSLVSTGVVAWFGATVSAALAPVGLGPLQLLGAVNAAYFAVHYLFAGQTSHAGALYGGMLGLLLAGGVAPAPAALSLAFTTNLFGSLTHYASGQAAAYAGAGYLPAARVARTGAATAVLSLAVWATVGVAWWRYLGLL